MDTIEGVLLTPLRIIKGDSGNVLHALKEEEKSFSGFGEAYFSTVKEGSIKGWKRHQIMVLNIVVPVGNIHFVMFDDRSDSPSYRIIQEVAISMENYQRLTIPPGVWMAFKGMGKGTNMLLNIANIAHNPAEAETMPLINDLIPYKGFL